MTNSKNPLRVAVIGYGYWGKNIARVFSQSSDFSLHTICDSNPKALENSSRPHPEAQKVRDFEAISPEVDVVAIITPTDSHFALAKRFLELGKHVFLTKPFTRTLAQTLELLAIAEAKGVSLFVDHTFIFNPAVRKLKEMLPQIGKPYFVISQRLNLGLYQPDVNVIYDLIPHDLSILSYLFGEPIVEARTAAFRAAGLPQEDLAHSSFTFGSGLHGLVTVSWLSPIKVRQFFIVGSEGMLLYDDMDPIGKIKFFNRGITIAEFANPNALQAYTAQISYRNGDFFSPAIAATEALSIELGEFKRTIDDRGHREAFNRINLDVMKGLHVVLEGLGK